VLLIDPRTGHLDERLNFDVPQTHTPVSIRLSWFARTESEIHLRAVSPPLPSAQVRFAGASATIVLPERLWRLTAAKRIGNAGP
jgi:hypothetical protein